MNISLSQEKELEIKHQLQKWLKDSNQIGICLMIITQSFYACTNIFSSSYFALKTGINRSNLIQYQKVLAKEIFSTSEKPIDNQQDIMHHIHQEANAFEPKQKISKTKTLLQYHKYHDAFLTKSFTLQVQKNYNKTLYAGYYQKFRKIFGQISNIYGIDYNEELIQSVLIHGANNLDHLTFQKAFTREQIRQDIHSILILTQSFNQLSKYGCNDLQKIQKQLSYQIQKCLLSLKVPIQFIQTIKDILIENPLSLDLTKMNILNQFKIKFFQSDLYTKGILEKYAQVLFYPQSLYAKAIQDISQLFKQIKNNCHITSQILTLIYSFNLYGLLQNPNIEPSKTKIYLIIRDKYKSYYKACQNVKYLGQKQQDLQIQITLKIRFELRKKFLQCKINLQKWEQTQDKLLDRNESIIHDLQLTHQGKEILRQFYRQSIQPYYHKLQKSKTFQEEVQQSLFFALMTNVRLKQKPTEMLLGFITELMQVQSLQGSNAAEDMTSNEKKEMISILKNNKEFQLYKMNQGIDKLQKQYQYSQKIKQLIYKINYQNKIQISYQSIKIFIQIFIKNNLQIPKELQFYVCDLKKLNQQLYPTQISKFVSPFQNQQSSVNYEETQQQEQSIITQIGPIIKSSNQALYKREKILQNFNQFLDKQIKKEQSHVLKFRAQQFGNNKQKFAQILLKNNPFQGEDIGKLNQLGIKKTVTKKNLMAQLKQLNRQKVKQFLLQYKNMQQCINGKQIIKQQSKSQLEPKGGKFNKLNIQNEIKLLNNKKSSIIAEFLKQYRSFDNKEEQTKLTSTILNKFKEPQEIIQKILDSNPFQNPEVSIFDQLIEKKEISKVQKSNLLKQFKKSIKCNELGCRFANEYKIIKQKLIFLMKDL